MADQEIHTPKGEDTRPEATAEEVNSASSETQSRKPRRHLIRCTWLRRTLKALMWIAIAILILPLLIYLPPIQTLLKNVACNMLSEETGMNVEIGRFRLGFPLDVSLHDVKILEATGDTMVLARELVADVKLMPLFKGDVELKKVLLKEGYYRMTSADSSMVLSLKAGFLSLDGGSSVELGSMNMDLKNPVLRNARINVAMDVWKAKPDTAPEPSTMVIKADRITLENVAYSMQMLPYIRNLSALIKSGKAVNGIVDLKNSKISVESFSANGGDIVYTTPTPEYIASHPLPVPSGEESSPPMTVEIGQIALQGFSALYTVEGASPVEGFDPAYIQMRNLNVAVKDFYNCASTLRVPIESVSGIERCGLSLTSGSGTLAINEQEIGLEDFSVATPFSELDFSARLSYAMLDFDPSGQVGAKGAGYIGYPDLAFYMPSLKTLLFALPGTPRAGIDIDMEGSLAELNIENFGIDMPGLLHLKSSGWAANLLDPDNLGLHLDLDGGVENTSPVNRMLAQTGAKLPAFTLSGSVDADGAQYAADLKMVSSRGKIALDGEVSLSPERYDAAVSIHGLDVASIMPSLGVGLVTADIRASGAGFNPSLPGANAHLEADVSHAVFQGFDYGPLSLDATVDKSIYALLLEARNPAMDLDLSAEGEIQGNDYLLSGEAQIYNLDLRAMNMTADTLQGHGWISIDGSANPAEMLFDLDLALRDVDLLLGQERIVLPHAADLRLYAQQDTTDIRLTGDQLNLAFTASEGLNALMQKGTDALSEITTQISDKQLNFETLHAALPRFNFSADVGAQGVLSQFIAPTGYDFDRFKMSLTNGEKINADISLSSLNTGSMLLDTITANFNQYDQRLLYKIHLGNRPSNLPELAKVDVNGYLGGNRGSLALRQWNSKGENGYKIGLTAAIADSVLSLHCTPLTAVIGYKDWTINADNYVELGPGKMIKANLKAQGMGSSIALSSGLTEKNHNYLDVVLQDVHLQDFLMMFTDMPPIRGDLSSNLHIELRPKGIVGKGTVNLDNFFYDNVRVGNVEANLRAGTNLSSGAGAIVDLSLDSNKIFTFRGGVRADSVTGEERTAIHMNLERFPLAAANAFLGPKTMQLSGYLNGGLDITGSLLSPVLNGELVCDTAGVYVPMAGTRFRLGNQKVTVTDNILDLNSFALYGAGKTPIVLNGTVDATKLSNILLDLSLKGNNVTLINNDKRARSEIYGRLDVSLNADVKGSLSRLDIDGNLSVLAPTAITYVWESAAVAADPTTTDVVRFVQFNDTTNKALPDSLPPSIMMKINAALNIVNGAQITVNLNSSGTNRAQIAPSGRITYTQSYMGDTRVNGQLNLNSGQVRYTPPLMSEKVFDIRPESYVAWSGEMMNPTLHLSANDHLKANVRQSGSNSRLIYFDVALNVSGTLEAMKVNFDLSTDDDLTVQNELLSMTPEQRSTQAMNLILYNSYTGPGVTASANLSNPLYSFLASQLNSWAARTIRGVDLSFGIDKYKNTLEGETNMATSYSYQVSKSLLDNKFKIVVGGNYATDASGDQEFVENLISDISFEYMLRQTNSMNMYLRLFRHTGWESILEGEITETGVGIVMKRKLMNLKQLFRFGRRRRAASVAAPADSAPADSVPAPQAAPLPADSIAPSPLFPTALPDSVKPAE